MALQDLLDSLGVVNCDASDVLGTGLAGCKKDRKRVNVLYVYDPTVKFTDVIDKASQQTLQQQGKLIVLQGVVSFVDSTPDDNIGTRDGSGQKNLIGKFDYEYTATFDNGVNFHKALTTLQSNGNYKIALGDVDDTIWLTTTLAGDVVPYSLGLLNPGKYLGNDGTNLPTQTLFMQLRDRNEVDKRMTWVTPTDFGSSDLDGVNDITIALDPIADGDTTIVFTPKLGDRTHLVEGLALSNLRLQKTVSGVTTTVTPSAISYTANPGKVTLTVATVSAGDVYTLQTYNSTLGTEITLTALGLLFKSNVATATVAP